MNVLLILNMNWKKFLKPTKKKLILPILALINIIINFTGSFILPDVINLLNLFIFFLLNFSGFIILANFGFWLDNYFVLGVFSIIQFIFWYLLSCWFLERRRKWLPKIILILVIVLNLVLSFFYLSGLGPIGDGVSGQEAIRRQSCETLDTSTGCLHDPSAIGVNYDVNEDGEIEISNDNWQTFADMFYGCGGDPVCAKRICGCYET